ncbi:FG-GAP repeat domain-containing protein [Streptomyces sp. NPDC093105]|uniref:FG-GAP repeat domain-containing protein n=1 Tax=Streptomyces sp. NPDC093105 TaxID=3366029 RepID=UPI00382770D5
MQFRTTRPRLAAAVTAVLAVTALGAGTLATAPAAFAATSGAVSATQADALPVFPAGSSVMGGGPTGFLTYGDAGLTWTPYDGGAATPIDLAAYDNGGWAPTGSDVVAIGNHGSFPQMTAVTLRDMAAPETPVLDIDLGALDANFVAVLGPKSVLAQATKSDGTAELIVVTQDGATPSTRKIAGLPADADRFVTNAAVQGDQILVGYETGPEEARTGARAVIDLAAGTAVETYASGTSGAFGGGPSALMFSGSHVAWTEWQSGSGQTVVSVERATGVRKTTVMGPDDEYRAVLVGDWLVYGNDWRPGLAVSLTDGRTVELSETATGIVTRGDGSALLSGRTATGGSGLFRLDPRTGEAPAVTKTAEMDPEPLAIEQVHIPDSVNLDSTGGKATLAWTLSRPDVEMSIVLTHTATGREFHGYVPAPASGTRFSFTWDGVLDDRTDGPNGEYAVEAYAMRADGVGEPVYQGWLTSIQRTANPHDFTDNGSTDVLVRDAAGVLWRDDLRDRPVNGQVKTMADPARIGSGWNTYKQIEAVGNIGGSATGDLVALDGSGVLWSYAGKGDGTFGTRVQVGGGWGVYNKLTGGSDLDGDERSDLLATDTSGVLWFYKGTGDLAKPFATRVRVGGGWGIYNQLTAVGNIAGTAAGDLVARDTAGVLWLYQGNGKGNFLTRTKIGGGWGAFSQLVGAGDVDSDGRPDLIAYGAGGTYVYHANGTVYGTFTRLNTTLYAGEGTKFTSVA